MHGHRPHPSPLEDNLLGHFASKSVLKGNKNETSKYLAVHLRFEIDMVAYSMCYFGGGKDEEEELEMYRQIHFPALTELRKTTKYVCRLIILFTILLPCIQMNVKIISSSPTLKNLPCQTRLLLLNRKIILYLWFWILIPFAISNCISATQISYWYVGPNPIEWQKVYGVQFQLINLLLALSNSIYIWKSHYYVRLPSAAFLRSEGKCPLAPEEAVLMLAAIGFKHSTNVYIAGAEIYGGRHRMAAISRLYPALVSKETLLSSSELEPFRNFSSQVIFFKIYRLAPCM